MTIKLNKVTIHEFRCIETDQNIDISPDVTVLVGMNESGKTSILEVMAKSDCYNDNSFKFDLLSDYPRKNLSYTRRTGENPSAISLYYECDEYTFKKISEDFGTSPGFRSFKLDVYYDNSKRYSFDQNSDEYKTCIEHILNKSIPGDLVEQILDCSEVSDLDSLQSDSIQAEDIAKLKSKCRDKENYDSIIDSYLFYTHIIPNIPKFMYFDEYYSLPSEVSLKNIGASKESYKTAMALLDLAKIDTSELKSDNFELVCSELEATQLDVTKELLQHWSTNSNLKFKFDIDKKEDPNHRIVDYILKIRIENTRYGVSLPLDRRSKGFNWFSSFLVWFKKIEMDNEKIIILMDEPGLNLHAKAQNDLLRFINEELGQRFQVIYTTHSPFMIDPAKLFNIRTIIEKDDGTHVSDCIEERDRDTLFPLQAALGYDIAQNLFISACNLVVEGVADLLYIETMSEYLKRNGRVGLDDQITIVPIGGADKVTSFISLLNGNKLEVVCLLDTLSHALEGKINSMVNKSIIDKGRILTFDVFVGSNRADIEDMFDKKDFEKLYNLSMNKSSSLSGDNPVLEQIKELEGKDFNHYIPAYYFAKNIDVCIISDTTIDRFESMFKEVNSLFQN